VRLRGPVALAGVRRDLALGELAGRRSDQLLLRCELEVQGCNLIRQMPDLSGKVAIVTGAGRGIGREHALALARAGARVVVNDLGATLAGERGDASPANQVVEEIRALRSEAVANGENVADFAGAERLARHAAADWRERAKAGDEVRGRVINTASPSGVVGNVGQANYGAAKAGIAGFTLIAAQELGRYGVTVNCIAPNARTRMTESAFGEL